jgi:hypothetical protein
MTDVKRLEDVTPEYIQSRIEARRARLKEELEQIDAQHKADRAAAVSCCREDSKTLRMTLKVLTSRPLLVKDANKMLNE